MDLPALLPEELKHTAVAVNEKNLFNLLLKIPEDFVHFLEYACDDETWTQAHPTFMKESLEWMTAQFFQDKLLLEWVQKIVSVIREHYPILHPFIPNNLTLTFNSTEVKVSGLMWGASSEILHQMIRHECRDQNTNALHLDDISTEIFPQVEEFINTGNVAGLWRNEQSEVRDVLRQASEWGLVKLELACEDLLTRYVTQENVVDTLITAHEEGWKILRDACFETINNLDIDVRLSEPFQMEFLKFSEDALEIYEELRFYITHLVCGGDLTEQEVFSDVVNRCPHLVRLDISQSNSFSELLVDIPDTLEELDISKCLWLTDKNFKQLVDICPNLGEIALASNTQLAYTGWGTLKHFPRLAKLDISRCAQVKDDEFVIILQSCRQVKHLILQECTGLTDHAFHDLGKHLPTITDLDISRCNLTDAALVDLSFRCKHLVTLDLTRCLNLTEKGVAECVQNQPNLRTLIVTKCRLAPDFVQELRKAHPFLEIIQ